MSTYSAGVYSKWLGTWLGIYYEMLELKVTAKEHLDIERETHRQGCSDKWHAVLRYKRITDSICGRILKRTVYLLVYCMSLS